MQRLVSLNLATEQEVAACESSVKRLCQNLPEFDSVWVDALVQRRVLSPWQADVLSSSKPERLRVGEYCKTDQISANTFHAVSVENSRQVVLHAVPSQSHATHLQRQIQALKDGPSTAPASLEYPRQFLTPGEADAATSPVAGHIACRFVAGWTAEDLIIRGGRIPWPAVAEIGRQALEALRWLEDQKLVHGNVNLQNLRLRPNGQAVLVSALLNSVAANGVSLTANLRLKDVAAVAPECVGSGIAASPRSDLYSLGCVLWQLLTARPPFLSADPVTKVLKSQETDIEDVRQIVPDCPDWLSRQLQSLTRRSPELRPASCADAHRQWEQHASAGVSQTRRLLKRLPDGSRSVVGQRHRASIGSSSGTTVVTVAAMIGLFAFLGFQRGLIPAPLNLARTGAVNQHPVAAPATATSVASAHASVAVAGVDVGQETAGPRTLPQPDAAGVVVLESGQAYVASDLEYAGVMHIETTAADVAIVQRGAQQTWRISADQIVMRNIEVRSVPADGKPVAASSPQTAVQCTCDVLALDKCRIDSGRGANRDRGIYWTPGAGLASVVSISNSVFQGSGYGIWMSQPPQRCDLKNLLVRTNRSALRFDVQGASRALVELSATGITQTGGISFVDAVVFDSSLPQLQVRLTCGESVLAVTTGLVQIAGPESWPLERVEVECLLPERGNPTIVPPGVRTAIGFDAGLNSVVALPESQIRAEALLIANPIFRGNHAQSAAQSRLQSRLQTADSAFELLDYEGPKLSQKLPGVDLSQLATTLQQAQASAAVHAN